MSQSEVPTVLIGKKPLMNYVFACLTTLQGGAKQLMVKARGRAISRAVDVVQILQRRFYKDLKVADIKLGTQEVMGPNNQPISISTIEILLKRES
ncbi:MAG: DNA-binding protein Alba [Nitrososphaerota archaeon]